MKQLYFPYINKATYYDNNDYLKSGRDWREIMHLFNSPFYMVDYSLATICAVQLWMKAQNDWEGAWQIYLQLCKAGGTQSFLELLQSVGSRSPFEEEVIREVAEFLESWLEGVDDGQF